MKPSRNMLTMLQRPTWDIRQLKNNEDFRRNIALPKESLGLDVEGFPYRLKPLQVISCRNRNFKQSIQEVVFGCHAKNIVSLIFYMRAGTKNQLFTAIDKFWIPHISGCDDWPGDRRVHAMFTTTKNIAEEVQAFRKILTMVESLSPFSDEMKNYINQFLDPNIEPSKIKHNFYQDLEAGPPYFKFRPWEMYWGETISYNPLSDDVIPKTLTPLIQAIIDDDLAGVKQAIANDPNCIFHRHPKLKRPANIAKDYCNIDIMREIIEAYEKSPRAIRTTIHNYKRIIEEEQFHIKLTDEKRKKLNAKYVDSLINHQPLKRQPLHAMAREGNLAGVKSILKNNPKLIESQDFLGYTPLVLACAGGHYELVSWLIEQGAALNDVLVYEIIDYGSHLINAVNSINSPQVMKLLLSHNVNPALASRVLEFSIKEKNYEMIDVLSYYLYQWQQDDEGYTPLDQVTIKSSDDIQLLKRFLKRWDQFVPEGPYDDFISKEVAEIFSEHNRQHQIKLFIKNTRPSISKIEQRYKQLILTLTYQHPESFDNIDIHLITKPLSQLERYSEYNEFFQCSWLFSRNFGFVNQDSMTNRVQFTKKVFAKDRENSYISLLKKQDDIIGFVLFELLDKFDDEYGDYKVFHGELAANHPQMEKTLSRRNVTSLCVQLIPYIMRQLIDKNIPLLVYGESIAPGFFMTMIPQSAKPFPIYHTFPRTVVEKIVNHTGETLTDEDRINTSFKSLKSVNNDNNFSLSRYSFFNGNQQKALPLTFEVTPEVTKEYQTHLEQFGFTDSRLKQATQSWQEALSYRGPQSKM